MKKIALSGILMFIISNLFAQVGFKLAYDRSNYDNVNIQFQTNEDEVDPIYQNIFVAGLNYRYKIPNTGFEFLPGISYSLALENNLGFSLQRFTFDLPIKVYPLNMEGDCDCPDFSLRNKFFEKHLFFLLTPSYNYDIKKLKSESKNLQFSNSYFKIGLGVGMAIPFSENLSLSPAISYNWAINDKWNEELFDKPTNGDVTSNYTNISFELRLHYKFER